MLTGRIDGVPADVLHQEVLAPQFEVELAQLLAWYLAIEKVLLLEYVRLGLASAADVAPMAARINDITPASLRADPRHNLSDIAFAIERHVATGPTEPFAAWHVDRSRNDLQACAQRMGARQAVLDTAGMLVDFGRSAMDLAERTVDLPMPGYTHLQAAQVISPGFYFSAIAAETLRTLRRLGSTFDEIDECPLGAGAMSGQELDWDRERLAAQLGFGRVAPHSLVAVASRGWVLSLAGDVSAYGVALSRFATDLMMWGSAGYGFLDLPDELSGISSAMPQKKNFPILERIRGRSAHLVAFAVDAALGQRSTPYANMVEVSKEAGARLWEMFDTLRSTLRLFATVLTHLQLREDRLRAACAREYLGGMTLANLLTIRGGLPWRVAQVVAGRYITRATERGLSPGEPDPDLLVAIIAEISDGRPGAASFTRTVADPRGLLTEAFGLDGALRIKRSSGSTHPERVGDLLAAQRHEFDALEQAWGRRRAAIDAALTGIDPQFADPFAVEA